MLNPAKGKELSEQYMTFCVRKDSPGYAQPPQILNIQDVGDVLFYVFAGGFYDPDELYVGKHVGEKNGYIVMGHLSNREIAIIRRNKQFQDASPENVNKVFIRPVKQSQAEENNDIALQAALDIVERRYNGKPLTTEELNQYLRTALPDVSKRQIRTIIAMMPFAHGVDVREGGDGEYLYHWAGV